MCDVRSRVICSTVHPQFATLQFTAEKHGWTKFVSMQNLYNLCYREEEREMFPTLKVRTKVQDSHFSG